MLSCMDSPPEPENWWSEAVLCAQVDEVMWKGSERKDIVYFGRHVGGVKRYVRLQWMHLEAPPYDQFWGCLDKPIQAFTEFDEAWFSWQPKGLITYHAFLVLEVEKAGWFGERLFIMCERCSDSMQLLFGKGSEAHAFIKEYYTTGRPRNVSLCSAQPRRPLSSGVTVRQFLSWLDSSVATGWQGYNILTMNCQHFVAEVQHFLLEPPGVA